MLPWCVHEVGGFLDKLYGVPYLSFVVWGRGVAQSEARYDNVAEDDGCEGEAK